MLFLNFFADAQPKYVDLEGILFIIYHLSALNHVIVWISSLHAVQADNLTPEVFASFPSKMTFSWYQARFAKDLI